jgi:hypothetical protein
MSRRTPHPLWVAVAALLAAGLGLFVTIEKLPSAERLRSDEISVLRANDQATVASPERRIGRSQVTAIADAGFARAVGVVGLLAALALATGLVQAPIVRRTRRDRHLGRALRAPPAPVPAIARVR